MLKLNDVFVQGQNKYVVTGFDSQGRPVASCDAKLVTAAEKKSKKKTKT